MINACTNIDLEQVHTF